jgi:3-hydroxyisobutyrate dehydrogenase
MNTGEPVADQATNVGYIGLGNIGKPSARRLIGEAYRAHVFDLNQSAVDELVSEGAIGCASVGELTTQCLHIGICVRDDAQVEALLQGAEGILAHAAKNTVVAIHSTVTQDSLLKWAEQAAVKGVHLIDAPITGGAARAEEGTLCYMVGGAPDIVARCLPIFETSAEKVMHCGELGTGIALKLCNNFIQYGEFVLMAEATRLATACGLSVNMLLELGLSNGVVNKQMHSFVANRNALALSVSEHDMEQFFGIYGKLATKDLQCALITAAQKNVSLPTAQYLHERIEDVFLAKDPSKPI